jgi:hypothetical protein
MGPAALGGAGVLAESLYGPLCAAGGLLAPGAAGLLGQALFGPPLAALSALGRTHGAPLSARQARTYSVNRFPDGEDAGVTDKGKGGGGAAAISGGGSSMRPTTPWVRQVISGVDLMRHPKYNKGLAFSEAERDRLYLRGLLPPAVLSQEVQLERAILNIRRASRAGPGPGRAARPRALRRRTCAGRGPGPGRGALSAGRGRGGARLARAISSRAARRGGGGGRFAANLWPGLPLPTRQRQREGGLQGRGPALAEAEAASQRGWPPRQRTVAAAPRRCIYIYSICHICI